MEISAYVFTQCWLSKKARFGTVSSKVVNLHRKNAIKQRLLKIYGKYRGSEMDAKISY
jgi:hypothetical protein